MMKRDESIVVQVAFKGAIELAVAGKIEIADVESTTKAFNKVMVDLIPEAEAEEGKFYKSNLNYNKVGNSASDKQINFIKQLKPQTTKAMQDKVDSINFDELKAKDASKLIEDLLADKEANTPPPF